MTLYGARDGTSAELMKALHWDSANYESFHEQLSHCIKTGNIENTGNESIKIVNKLFLDSKFQLLESYGKAIKNLYNGGIDKVQRILIF